MSKIIRLFIGLMIVSLVACGNFGRAKALENTRDEDATKIVFSADKTTAIANGSDRITFTYGAFWIAQSPLTLCSTDASSSNPLPATTTLIPGQSCQGAIYSGKLQLTKAGNGLTVSPSTTVDSSGNLADYEASSGLGSFAITSTEEGQKTLIFSVLPLIPGEITRTLTLVVNFTSTQPATSATPTTQTTPANIYKTTINADKISATADGKDLINFNITVKNSSNTIVTDKKPSITVSGTDNTISALTLDKTTKTWKGTLSSTKPEGKIITSKVDNANSTLKITFVTPAAALATAQPTIVGLKVNGSAYTAESAINVENGQNVTLSGTTAANAVVDLYVDSNSSPIEVVADEDGNWSYTLEKLETGNHQVEAQITDPITKVQSDKTLLASFSVKAAQSTAPVDKKSNNLKYLLIGIGLLLLVSGGFLLWWLKFRKKKN